MQLIDDLLGFIVPRTCLVCGHTLVHGERHICLSCNCEMPRTHLHRMPCTRISDRLPRLQPSTPLAAWFYYRRATPWAHLVHAAKYGGRPALARDLGRLFAIEPAADGFFDDVDCLVPVPMHYTKRLTRGFNQSQMIAKGVSDVTGLPVDTSLIALRPHSTQTRHTAIERTHNVKASLFDVKSNHTLAGKRVVVVDDVVTTGATVEAVADILLSKAGVSQAKVLCLGLTEND